MCPDRPAKGTSPCTVDPGRLQVEVDAFDLTRDRDGGSSTTDAVAMAPTLKLGVTGWADVEASVNLYESVRERTGGVRSRVSGVGDLVLKAKMNLTGGGDGWNVAALPYVKAPTAARGLGDGAWEGGLIFAFAGPLPAGWSLDVTPEVDRWLNASGRGRHTAASLSAGLSHDVAGVSVTGELWGQTEDDPAGVVRQLSADLGLAWQPPGRANLAFDAGINLGLTRATPDVQAYLGVSQRF